MLAAGCSQHWGVCVCVGREEEDGEDVSTSGWSSPLLQLIVTSIPGGDMSLRNTLSCPSAWQNDLGVLGAPSAVWVGSTFCPHPFQTVFMVT